MDPIQIVESTADAAFASDEEGRLVVWNEAAERLLGHKAHKVLGKPCHEVVCGTDVFGNRFCDKDCNLSKMVRRKEPIGEIADADHQLPGHTGTDVSLPNSKVDC